MEVQLTVASKISIGVILLLSGLFTAWAYFSPIGWVALGFTGVAAFFLKENIQLCRVEDETQDRSS